MPILPLKAYNNAHNVLIHFLWAYVLSVNAIHSEMHPVWWEVFYKTSRQGSYRPWKVLKFYCSEFQAWKVLEKGMGPGKPWKTLESPGILKQRFWIFYLWYISAVTSGKYSKPNNVSYEVVRNTCTSDALLCAKLKFFNSVAKQMVPFLT